MYKLIIFLVVSMMCSNVVFAQTNADAIVADREAFWEKIDTSTEWGKWLETEFRPYWVKMSEALSLIRPPLPPDFFNLSSKELMRKVYEGHGKCYEAMQKITPPDGLQAYHEKTLEYYSTISKNVPGHQQEASPSQEVSQLGADADRELFRVLTQHGVPPQVIIDLTIADKLRSLNEAFWNDYIDTATEWGKWLMTTQSYWDKVFEAKLKVIMGSEILSRMSVPTENDVNKAIAETIALEEGFHKAMQDITPPEELKALHAILVEESAFIVKEYSDGNQFTTEVDKLKDKSFKERDILFKKHGVPENIIKGFNRYLYLYR